MAKVVTKGTVLQLTISSSLTPIVQIVDFDKALDQGETVDSDTLDNASAFMPKSPTMRSSVGDISGNLLFDPAAVTHQFISDTISVPIFAGVVGKIIFADGTSKDYDFTVKGMGLGFSVQQGNLLRAPFALTIDTPVWET